MKRIALGLLTTTLLSGAAFAQAPAAAPPAAATSAAAPTAAAAAAPPSATLTPFTFQTIASRNPAFDRSSYVYPEGGDNAGKVNPNVGDVRLDGVNINGTIYNQDKLELVTGAKVLDDDAVDVPRGGHNLAAGVGIGAAVDNWVNEGVSTTTPTEANLVANYGNFNLTSIVATREGTGTTVFQLSFDKPTSDLLIWERGGDSDVWVAALDDSGTVIAQYKVARTAYARTGIIATTWTTPTFTNQGQELGSIGLHVSKPVSKFLFTAYQEAAVDGAARFNGPDLKVLAVAPAAK